MQKRSLRAGRVVSRQRLKRDVVSVARDLLGCVLRRRLDDQWVGGVIVETEAYLATGDAASHSARGQTPGNRNMFAEAGTAYVYPIHAKHCFNVSAEASGVGAAVLIRALEPVWGLDTMRRLRGVEEVDRLTSGPGMLCQAMSIDRSMDGCDLCVIGEPSRQGLSLHAGVQKSHFVVQSSPRIGISKAKAKRLRFFVDGNRFVSGTRKGHVLPKCHRFVDGDARV